jgi:hypothetical protein
VQQLARECYCVHGAHLSQIYHCSKVKQMRQVLRQATGPYLQLQKRLDPFPWIWNTSHTSECKLQGPYRKNGTRMTEVAAKQLKIWEDVLFTLIHTCTTTMNDQWLGMHSNPRAWGKSSLKVDVLLGGVNTSPNSEFHRTIQDYIIRVASTASFKLNTYDRHSMWSLLLVTPNFFFGCSTTWTFIL